MKISGSTPQGQVRQQDKVTGNDKPKNTAQPAESGGLSAKALWDSQAGRRAEEKAAAAAEKARRQTVPAGPAAVTDGSDAALRTLQDTVKLTAGARRRDETRAAERADAARRAEQARSAQLQAGEKPDPFRAEPQPELRTVTAFRPPEPRPELSSLEPGTLLDTFA